MEDANRCARKGDRHIRLTRKNVGRSYTAHVGIAAIFPHAFMDALAFLYLFRALDLSCDLAKLSVLHSHHVFQIANSLRGKRWN